jgi:phosphoribosyl 1,2-cyclic phosphodiesterase
MRFASLGSGSRGNGTLVEVDEVCLLVDCGFSVRETESRLGRLGKTLADIDAILVTHEHGDHYRGVGPCSRNANLPVYMTAGTHYAVRDSGPDNVVLFDCHEAFEIGGIQVLPIAVPHDAREPSQFVFAAGGHRLGLLTDAGSVTSHMTEQYRHCDALLLESNHDPEMLAGGSYPVKVKQRVAGDWGHLSNRQATEFLMTTALPGLQHLVVAHISEQNNTLEAVQQAITDADVDSANTVYASQSEGFDWLTII